MKVLTLHQPWATLIALGVKTIETRPNRTHVRGRIAIHAAARPWLFSDAPDAFQAFCQATPNVAKSSAWWEHTFVRGAVVATANLVDCVPFEDLDAPNDEVATLDEPVVIYVRPNDPGSEDFALLARRHQAPPVDVDVSDQMPYGNFAPGRWAWLLEDVEPLAAPVPFRGGQGWSKSWEPAT